MTFHANMLKPLSWDALFSSMGVASFSLGYNFSFLSFFVLYKPSLSKIETSPTCSKDQGQESTHSMHWRYYHKLAGPSFVSLLLVLCLSREGRMIAVSSIGGIKQDILLSIPKENVISIIISIMMFLSCLFTYPIYSPPLNEILEESCNSLILSIHIHSYPFIIL